MQINLQLFQLASRRPCPTGVKFHYVIIILLLCAFYGFYSVLWQGHPSLLLFFPGILCHNAHYRTLKKLIDIMSQTENTPWFAIVSFYIFLLFHIISYYLLIHIMHIPSMEIWTICRKQGSVSELRHTQCCGIVMSKDSGRHVRACSERHELAAPGIARGAAAATRPRGAVRARAGRADLLDALEDRVRRGWLPLGGARRARRPWAIQEAAEGRERLFAFNSVDHEALWRWLE